MRFDNLNDWLAWQESLNPAEIELGLERVTAVLAQAGLSTSFNCPLITVAGTNGKGSVVAMLEAMAIAAGVKVCSYTSPHLFEYNERIKINGRPVSDDDLCQSFQRIDQARNLPAGNSPLTYFEFGTLAAIDLFFRQQPELVILEVGLGGRLDAVNIMDADVSVLTSVAIDHVDWLGDNLESIGFEKAGIFRPGKPVICGERNAPDSVIKHAEKLQCEFIQLGSDYEAVLEAENGRWKLTSPFSDLADLRQSSLAGDFQYSNAATAIVALQALQAKSLFARHLSRAGAFSGMIAGALKQINLPGRFQQLNVNPRVYVDVAHNPQAALALASQLQASRQQTTKTWAIVAMLADKDLAGVLDSVSAQIDYWCFAGLENVTRGQSVEALLDNLPAHFFQDNAIAETNQQKRCKMTQENRFPDTVFQAKTVTKACKLILSKASLNDRIIIFGSFYTVAQAMQYFSHYNQAQVNADEVESIN